MKKEDLLTSNCDLVEDVKLISHNLNLLRTLTMAISFKDKLTFLHSVGVRKYSVMIGTMLGLPKAQICELRMGALLHDIGKIGVSDNILLKTDKLSHKEYSDIRKHPEIGARLLAYSGPLKAAIPTVLYHHERFDGCGYPQGLKREDIPLLARIVTVADSFEAMTSSRPYRKSLSIREAIQELYQHSGTQFDPMIVHAFINVIEEKNLYSFT